MLYISSRKAIKNRPYQPTDLFNFTQTAFFFYLHIKRRAGKNQSAIEIKPDIRPNFFINIMNEFFR